MNSQKLDPKLQAVLEAPTLLADAAQAFDVLVAVAAPLNDEQRADLSARGLVVRTDTGTILTGRVAREDIVRLAAAAAIVMIELSSPLFAEQPPSSEADIATATNEWDDLSG